MPVVPDVSPPDYSRVIGQIRLLIPDVEQLEYLADHAFNGVSLLT
jgi:hypothetical protein